MKNNRRLKDFTILNGLNQPEYMEIWLYTVEIIYKQCNRSIQLTESIGKEDGFFHFSSKRERIINSEEYGKSYLLKPGYKQTKEGHQMIVPLFVYPTKVHIDKARQEALSKLILILEQKTIEQEPNKKQLLKRLKLFV